MQVKDYKIYRLDDYNIVIEQTKKTKKGGLTNVRLGYYGTWEGALIALLNKFIKSEEAKEILKEIQEAKKEIIKELKNIKEK